MAKKNKPPKGESLLVELLTEELPPKLLKHLSDAFADKILNGLVHHQLKQRVPDQRVFATPRRLAVLIPNVLSKAQDRSDSKKLMPIEVAFDTQGNPTTALLKRLEKEGLSGKEVAKNIERRFEGDTEYAYVNLTIRGVTLSSSLQAIVREAIEKLPAPKMMSYQLADGETTERFVRPVHGVMLLYGAKVVPGTVLGLKSGNKTLGHRFLSEGAVIIRRAADYEKTLLAQGKVIASFEQRRAIIVKELDKSAAKFGKSTNWRLGKEMELVDEVTSIVENPRVYVGGFDPAFLEVPRECLVVSMQQHQKYFPLADASGKLLAKFLFVSNMQPKDASQIVHGNERVLRARLSDAKFFYDQDRKHKLDERVPRLANVVYHNKLGSQLDRVKRIQKIAAGIAQMLGTDVALVERAAYLAKADLLTEMVGEFPELQGIMGRYYAHHDSEATEVADAIEQHYFPRAAAGQLPQQPVAACVALADKLDVLAGLFGVGQQPTGDKDPFGLRRAGLGILRIIMEKQLQLSSNDLVNLAFAAQPQGVGNVGTDLLLFLNDRLRGYLRENGHSAQEVDTVLSAGTLRLSDVPAVLDAIKQFQKLPEAADLAAANKRIVNILKKAGVEKVHAAASALVEPAERVLYEAMQRLKPEVESRFSAHDYTGALRVLAKLKQPVDEFFEKVMVMAEDARLRDNRLALLGDLKALMNCVADISKLAA